MQYSSRSVMPTALCNLDRGAWPMVAWWTLDTDGHRRPSATDLENLPGGRPLLPCVWSMPQHPATSPAPATTTRPPNTSPLPLVPRLSSNPDARLCLAERAWRGMHSNQTTYIHTGRQGIRLILSRALSNDNTNWGLYLKPTSDFTFLKRARRVISLAQVSVISPRFEIIFTWACDIGL